MSIVHYLSQTTWFLWGERILRKPEKTTMPIREKKHDSWNILSAMVYLLFYFLYGNFRMKTWYAIALQIYLMNNVRILLILWELFSSTWKKRPLIWHRLQYQVGRLHPLLVRIQRIFGFSNSGYLPIKTGLYLIYNTPVQVKQGQA